MEIDLSRKHALRTWVPIVLITMSGAAGLAWAQTETPGPVVEPLLETGQDILGRPTVYPTGTPQVTSAILTVAPGGIVPLHKHPVPLYVHMLEGSITIDYGEKGTRTYVAGGTFLEAVEWPHQGKNPGDVPVRILTVYIGVEGMKGSEVIEN